MAIDLDVLIGLVWFADLTALDASIASNRQTTADRTHVSTVFDGGTSIGRALRLRIESLLI